jgi:ribosomal protein S18 acetylase RimI-like enzyme
MQAAIDALRARGISKLSLTVTAANDPAVRLYRKLGFVPIKTFTAGVWRAGRRD